MDRFFVSFVLIISLLVNLVGCGEIIRYNGDIFIHNRNVATNIHGRKMFWRHLPVTLIVSSNIPRAEKDKIEAAAADWNAAVGCGVFTVERGEETRDEGTVFIFRKRLGKSSDGKILGEATRYYHVDTLGVPDYIEFGRIKMQTNMALRLWQKTVVHELGHVLSLSHDKTIESIMWPFLNESRGVIMRNDIEFVKSHCPRPACQPNYCPLPR